MTANCIGFNPVAVKVVPFKAEWRLIAGGRILKSFGAQRGTARRALDIIRRYGLNKHCVIGPPRPSFEYWLVDDRLPSGSLKGERCIPISADRSRIKPDGRAWALVANGRKFKVFRTRRGAEAALATIRNYGARHFCEIGITPNSMFYLRR